jgi:hypothetical protein
MERECFIRTKGPISVPIYCTNMNIKGNNSEQIFIILFSALLSLCKYSWKNLIQLHDGNRIS